MSVFFNLHFLQNLIYPFLEISSKDVQILDVLFFIKRWFTKFAQKSHIFWKFTKIVWLFLFKKLQKLHDFYMELYKNCIKIGRFFFIGYGITDLKPILIKFQK